AGGPADVRRERRLADPLGERLRLDAAIDADLEPPVAAPDDLGLGGLARRPRSVAERDPLPDRQPARRPRQDAPALAVGSDVGARDQKELDGAAARPPPPAQPRRKHAAPVDDEEVARAQ